MFYSTCHNRQRRPASLLVLVLLLFTILSLATSGPSTHSCNDLQMRPPPRERRPCTPLPPGQRRNCMLSDRQQVPVWHVQV